MSKGNGIDNHLELNDNAAAPDSTAQEHLSSQTSEIVGYKKPPTHSQFKPGQSGNRKGRPKGAFTAKGLFRKVMNEKLTVTDKGRSIKLPSAELVFIALRNKALKGDLKALQTTFDFMRIWDLEDQKGIGNLFRVEFFNDQANADEALVVKKYPDILETK